MSTGLQSAATILGCDPADVVLLLRTCDSTRQGHGGFQWPESGPVIAPDWDPKSQCGHGLHGFLWGVGYGRLADWNKDAWWMVVAAYRSHVIDLGGNVKVPCCVVVYASQDRHEATQFLYKHLPPGTFPVIGITLSGGDYTTLTGGYQATLTGGHGSTLTGGDHSTLMGGDHSTLMGGDYTFLTGGDYSTLMGYRASLTGGENSTLSWKWWDGDRWRVKTVYVGEDGIKAGTAYVCQNGVVSEAHHSEES